MLDIRVPRCVRSVVAAALLVAALPLAANAAPFSWAIPSGVETWSTDHVHTILWSGGPAGSVNIYLINVSLNMSLQTVVLNSPNDGEAAFRLGNSLPPGTYLFYIEDTAVTTWTYGPQFEIQATPACVSPCTQGAFGAPLVVCGQTQAEAESLAIALAEMHIACGMAGTVDPATISIETTLLAVGGFNCPAGYTGAYAVEVSAVWCCCQQPVLTLPSSWSQVKAMYRDLEE